MARLTLLGSSATLTDAHHDTTYMVVRGKHSSFLIDCGGSPFQRLQQAKADLNSLEGLIITHRHADHIYGVPVLMQGLWLYGRERALTIYGPAQALQALKAIMDILGWQRWSGMFPIHFQEVPPTEGYVILESEEFTITSSPVRHLLPTIGLRITSRESGGVLVYSSDTEPCPEVVRLAQGADILLHESTGPHPGHSSGAQAGAVAREAGVKRLVLVHYPTFASDPQALLEEARSAFGGPVELGEDFATYEF